MSSDAKVQRRGSDHFVLGARTSRPHSVRSTLNCFLEINTNVRALRSVRTGRPRSRQRDTWRRSLDLTRTKSENALPMKLTSEQIDRYDRDGFLVMENFVDDEACDGLRARAEELVCEFD